MRKRNNSQSPWKMPVPGHCPWTGATHRQLLHGPAATQACVTPCITANTAACCRRERARGGRRPLGSVPAGPAARTFHQGARCPRGLPEPPPHAAPTTAPGGHGAATLPTGPAATRRRCRASCTAPGARARGGPVAPPGGAVVLRPGARRDVISEHTERKIAVKRILWLAYLLLNPRNSSPKERLSSLFTQAGRQAGTHSNNFPL